MLSLQTKALGDQYCEARTVIVVTEEWPALECIALKVKVHPSHCLSWSQLVSRGFLPHTRTEYRKKERETVDHDGY